LTCGDRLFECLCQAAIPLATMSAGRVTNLYDLMDSAYDVAEITA
jgi:hypothetical protein